MKVRLSTDPKTGEVRFVVSAQSPFVRAVRLFKRWRRPPRKAGLLRGTFVVRDDFDDSLPEDFLIKEPIRETTP